ncbi:MAG: hypothetical protein HS132_05305 [Planctomycetia bacterium]|nr:hypothetical protein [Planctomycetia bacterium]
MFKQYKKAFVSGSFIISLLITGAALPVVASANDKIVGAVSSIDESTGTLTIISNLVKINANNAKIKKKGLNNATLSDIQEGDIIKITGAADDAGIIEASGLKDPVKLKKIYDGKFSGKAEKVNISADTFYIMGQKVYASNQLGVTMGNTTISFNSMRSGVRVDVYVIDKNSQLVAKKMVIRSESCNFCH